MKIKINIISFDADDTLWINEPYFKEIEKSFIELLSKYSSKEKISAELFSTEMENLALYGYGVKGFTLSMIQTALKLSKHKISSLEIEKIIGLGKELLNKPIVLLDEVNEVLERLSKLNYKLIIATKGDLLDQERKLKKSGIIKYFHHIEVMSDKKEADYSNLFNKLDILPEEFLMIGNSLKSDIFPVVNLGGYGVHIPYHTTWQHEKVENKSNSSRIFEIDHLMEIFEVIKL